MTKKLFILPFLFIAGLLVLAGGSCESDQTITHSSGSIIDTGNSIAPVTVEAGLQPVIEKISQGQMEQAKQLLEQEKDSESFEQLKLLLRQYDQLQEFREQEKERAYQEQLDDLNGFRKQAAAKEIVDVNDIDEIMLAVVRAREFAAEEQKEQLLTEPFVQKVLLQMQQKADEDEQQGKWLDAYIHNYYWLMALYEDSPEYKDKGEELTELATIELLLKDSSCGETAVERYEGIEPDMFSKALKLLGSSYVTVVDFEEMAEQGLQRCRLLGRVLEQTNEDLAWKASKEAVKEWASGMEDIQTRTEQADMEDTPMKMETLEGIFEDVLALNSVTLELPEEVIIAQFTEASFAALDPYTMLVWPWNVKDFEKSMTQQFTGIGVEISKATGVLKVASLLPDTPAYKAGLDADDEIVAVDGEPTKDMTIYCAVDKITGPKGTKVTLTIRRPSTGQTKDFTITRDRIVVDPLRGWTRDTAGQWEYMIDPANGIGYIRLMQFTENSAPDIDAVLKGLEKEGLTGLVLDLRFNTGGYLQAAADVVDLFVEEGVIVKSNPRHGFANYEIAHRSGTHPNYPLVVLINSSSASASEIVAGALQDSEHQRAILVGERSYGKGSVQVITSYTGSGSQMKYTMAYYHLPSDQRVESRYQMEKQGRKDWGIAPDVEVKMSSNEIRNMIDIQRDNDVLFQNGHGDGDGQVKRHVLEETLQADPQLSIGMMIVRSRLAAAGKTLVLKDPFEQSPETVNAQP
ncbi:MAG: S41 family peptidase [Phycisphaerae bacterium]|nr:S41 family peptidase [Phycisphaerae bacterium]